MSRPRMGDGGALPLGLDRNRSPPLAAIEFRFTVSPHRRDAQLPAAHNDNEFRWTVADSIPSRADAPVWLLTRHVPGGR